MVLVAPGPVGATDAAECQPGLVERSGSIDTAAVDAALDRIAVERVGPDAAVVIRVWDEAPGGDVVAAVDDLVVACFGDPDGGIADAVAVIALSTGGRQTDVLIGARWVAAGVDAEQVRAEAMGPLLAEDDFTGALVAAAEALAARADQLPATEQADVEPSADADDGSAEADDEDDESEAPGPSVGPGRSGAAVALGVGAVAACGGAVALAYRRRSLTRRRESLRRSLEPALGRLRLLRERDDRLAAEADGWYQISAGRTKTLLGTGIREAEAARRTTDRAAGMVQQSLPDGLAKASGDQMTQARTRIEELARTTGSHGLVLDDLAALGARIDHLRVAVPAKADLLAAELPEVRSAANERAEDGWDTGKHRARLTEVMGVVDEVRQAGTQLEIDVIELSDRIEEAEAELFSVDHDLRSLEDRAPSLQAWAKGLREAERHEHERVQEARRSLVSAAQVHAASSWQWAADHPERAAEHLHDAAELVEETMSQLVPAQRFDQAGHELDQAGLELIEADDLLDQVDDLLVDLERARAEAPDIVDQARNVLVELGGFVAAHRADLSGEVVERVRGLASPITGLERELARPKPDYLQVAETGQRLSMEMDGLLVRAEDERLAAEAIRRELAREVARARRALARARRSLGWQLFPTADGAALDQLESGLDSLPSDPAAALETAGGIADDALWVQERIIARRRRRNLSVGVGTGASAPGRRGWSGGSSGRSRPTSSRPSWSSGSRSFRGGRRSSGSRSIGSRRSSGRF